MQAGPFQDALPDCSATLFPRLRVGDLPGDAVQFGLPLLRLEITAPAQGGLVFRLSERAENRGGEQGGERTRHAVILGGNE